MSYAVSPSAYSSVATSPDRVLRLWPGLLAVLCQWLMIKIPPLADLTGFVQFMGKFYGPILGVLGVLIWWLFASRARWVDRLMIPIFFALIGVGAYFLLDPSFAGMAFVIYGVPIITTAWVLWLTLGAALSWNIQRIGLVLVFLLAWGSCTMARFDGVDGAFNGEISYRWSQTAEQKFLAERKANLEAAPKESSTEKLTARAGDWPGFRGADREARLTGFRIDTDWSTPPRELWRHRVGPSWSSFCVVGDRLYTQEQRDKEEVVVCYHTDTGKERWVYANKVRFEEAVAGPGPRATPTFYEGKLYALGAKGKLDCLDAVTGKPIWSRDIVEESGAKVPMWAFSASPLVAKGLVSVFAGGPDGNSVLAYDAETGKPAWASGEGLNSYSSTQLVRLGGVEQIVVPSGEELTAFDPTTGKVLWKHEWAMDKGMARCIQTAVLGDSDVLLGTPFNKGMRRLKVTKKGDAWTAEEVWTTLKISPYFNDLVVHEGHAYGFDGNFFTCINLEDGDRTWRVRGYGSGQVLLLADQGLLLILSEKGEVSLLKATPESHQVLGKFTALTGKTWNHPVIAGGKLFVRNGEEMACFEMRSAK